MDNTELNNAKDKFQSRLLDLNRMSGEALRAYIKKTFGVDPATDATEADMRQTAMVWSMDMFFPTKIH